MAPRESPSALPYLKGLTGLEFRRGTSPSPSGWINRRPVSRDVHLLKPRLRPGLLFCVLCYIGCGDRPCDHPFGARSPGQLTPLAGASFCRGLGASLSQQADCDRRLNLHRWLLPPPVPGSLGVLSRSRRGFSICGQQLCNALGQPHSASSYEAVANRERSTRSGGLANSMGVLFRLSD